MRASNVPLSKPLAASLLQALLMVAVCLPSGSIFGLNAKMILFAVFSLSFLAYLVVPSSERPSSSDFVGIAVFCAGLCFWGVVAIVYGQSQETQVLLHLKDIASTVALAWLCIFCVRRGLLRPEGIIIPIVYGTVALALMKIALIVLTFGPKIDPIQLLETVFGKDALVGGSIGLGLTRVEFPSDIIGSFVLFILLCPTVSGIRFRRIFVGFAVTILIASSLLAFARYIWLLEAVAIVAAMVIERKFKWLFAAALAIVVVAYVSTESFQMLGSSRFVSDHVSDSDQIRIDQSKALLDEIQTRPLLGKGLGAHADGLIRNDQNQYSYELQWLALTMQFGFVGIAGIFLLLAASARDLLASQHPAKVWLLLLFGLWLLSGWTNPHLTSSFAGALFGMFMAIFYRIRVNAPQDDYARLT